MAENRARHAFGKSSSIEAAKQANKIDAYDILFLDGDTDPKIGWLDSQGNIVIVPSVSEVEGQVAELEKELATKVDAESITALETEIGSKVSAEEVDAKIANKADAAEVDTKINTAVSNTVTTANAYTDEKLEAALGEYLAKKYEISHKPEGTLVNYRDKEIRVMCPANTKWVKQNVGGTGNANMYYMGFKAYAPDNAVSFKEDDKAIIEDQTMYSFENNSFAGIDENGRKYSISWLALASYDEASDTWSYFGAKSTAEKYIGWYYSVEWFDDKGILIASDCIRINLSNENCHSSIEPYYVGSMMNEIDEKIDTKIAEAAGAIEVIEF